MAISGAPATSSVALRILGDGFVLLGLAGAACSFSRDAGEGAATDMAVSRVLSPATTLSPTEISCKTPATGVPASWILSVLLNGVTAAPSMYDALRIFEYDLNLVRISHVAPRSGPVGEAATVTIFGAGFARYGDGQLKCSASGLLLDGVLLDENRVLCTLPAQSAPTSLILALSLNAGSNGTFSPDQPTWQAYQPPTLLSIEPAVGDANGGTDVTVSNLVFFESAPKGGHGAPLAPFSPPAWRLKWL